MTPTARPGDRHLGRRLVLALLGAALLVAAVACSDAPTEKEIAMADDGVDPSIVPIFTSEDLLTVAQDLGTVFLIDHPGVTFQYIAKPPDVLGERVRSGVLPVLWIDEAQVLEPFVSDAAARGEPAPVGDDVVQFVLYKTYTGPKPTLEVFGAGTFPTRSGLCDAAVPCGRGALEVLEAAGVTPEPDLTFPTGRELVDGFVDEQLDTALMYRSDAARIWTAFKLQPMPDPTIGTRTYESLRLRDDPIGESFQKWIASSPEADAILVKRGLRARPGVPTP